MSGAPVHWSFSSLSTWMDCPARYKYQYVERLPQPSSPALERGNVIHNDLELGVAKAVAANKPGAYALPPSLDMSAADRAYWLPKFQDLVTREAKVEAKWEFDEDWHLIKQTNQPKWCVVKLDVSYRDGPELNVIDYKTGKVYEQKHRWQMEIYGIGGFAYHFESIERVRTQLWYLDQRHVTERTFDLPTVRTLAGRWRQRADSMLKDRTYAPSPGTPCRYCPFRSDKGGPCRSHL